MPTTLKVLGCRSGGPTKDSPCSGYLLKLGSGTVLIDCGPGISTEMTDLEYDSLFGIIISHLHADHLLDIMALGYRQTFPVLRKRIPLFCNQSTFDVIERFDDIFGIKTLPSMSKPIQNGFDIRIVNTGDSFEIAGAGVFDTLKMIHPVPTMAIRNVKIGFSYTADGAFSEKLVDFCKGSELLISEATYLEKGNHNLIEHGHMTSCQTGILGEQSGSLNLFVSHLGDYANKVETMKNVRENFHGKAVLSYPGLEYTFTRN